MKKMLWCLVSGVALATTAYAGDDEMKHGSAHDKLTMMDTDGDGSVSATEHAASAKKMFGKMDTDRDGIVTANEMDSAHKDMPAGRTTSRATDSGRIPQADPSARSSDASGKPMKSKMSAMDADSDGTITAAEHEAGAKRMFDKMDKDDNSRLSAAELQAGHEKMTAEDQ